MNSNYFYIENIKWEQKKHSPTSHLLAYSEGDYLHLIELKFDVISLTSMRHRDLNTEVEVLPCRPFEDFLNYFGSESMIDVFSDEDKAIPYITGTYLINPKKGTRSYRHVKIIRTKCLSTSLASRNLLDQELLAFLLSEKTWHHLTPSQLPPKHLVSLLDVVCQESESDRSGLFKTIAKSEIPGFIQSCAN